MKKFARFAMLFILLLFSLTLFQAGLSFGAPASPAQVPSSYSPIRNAQDVMEQVRAAAEAQTEADPLQPGQMKPPEQMEQSEQMERLKEVMEAQQKALSEFSDQGEELSEENALSQEPDAGTGTQAGAETGTEAETETETETELPEETETEFQPVEMGVLLPDTGGAFPEETETEAETEVAPQTQETQQPDDSVMASRHGTFAVPRIEGMNEARICLYDYRMLRTFPLSRLPKDLHILYDQLREQVASYDGTWSVYVQNLTTGQALVVNDKPMRSASVMKLFIMETVYEAFDRADLERNEDTVYLLRTMIINSSNESSNRLLALLGDGDIAAGIARVNEFIRLRGFSPKTVAYNGFQDPAASVDPSHPNIVMAKDVGLLLSRVYNRTFLSRRVCNEIEQMMLEQATRYKIPRGLPEGVECGNKSGETDTIANDAAVVYGPTTDYILVVLSNDWSSEDGANAQVAEISSAVYDFFER